MKWYIKTEEEVKEGQKNRSSDDKAAIEVMVNNDAYQDDPMVGMFWYDIKNKELFGVRSSFAEDNSWYESTQWGTEIKTDRRLHKDVWKKEYHRKKDSRFFGNHTLVPRGRVFEFKDKGLKVYVGDWIDDYPEAKDAIIDEFQLPDDVEFVKDVHWDIGHGFSDEF